MLSISNSIAITINSIQINLLCCSIIIFIITGYCIICNYMQEPNQYNRTRKLPKGCVTTAGGVQRMELPVPEMSATGLAYAADICGLPLKSLRKLASVRRCPLQIRRCPCLCQSLRTFADIFPYQLGLSFCGRPQLYAS